MVTAATVLLIGGCAVAFYFDPDEQHRRVVRRIGRWVRPELNAPTALEARGIHEVKRALFTASGNWPLWYRTNAPTEKLAAVADYLDRTQGADFASYGGALHVLALLEEVSPTLHDYPWIEQLREMQADGSIPAPQARQVPVTLGQGGALPARK